MLEFIGLVVGWWLGWMAIGMIVNSFRLKSNPAGNINDSLSGVMIGIAVGPFGLLPPFDDKTIGGILGTIGLIWVYTNL